MRAWRQSAEGTCVPVWWLTLPRPGPRVLVSPKWHELPRPQEWQLPGQAMEGVLFTASMNPPWSRAVV